MGFAVRVYEAFKEDEVKANSYMVHPLPHLLLNEEKPLYSS
ncbi:MAG TPA: hypothetical protein PK104_11085 [Spirochaetota bacterium]|mgnify:CR=1 FL=1|jgi:hypothetical protein|nr:hypothetical protein [Spirochaetota bacterium]